MKNTEIPGVINFRFCEISQKQIEQKVKNPAAFYSCIECQSLLIM